MRKARFLLSLMLVATLALTGCASKEKKEEATTVEKENTTTAEQKETTQNETTEKVTEEATEAIPENYAATVVVTINPEVKLYLDIDNNVIYVECLNDDAKEIVKEVKLVGEPISKATNEIVKTSIDKGFLSEEKGNAVKIEVAEVKDEKYDVKETLTVVEESVSVVLEEAKIDNEIETVVSEEVKEIIDAKPDVCEECGGTGYTCPECGGHEFETCVCCSGTGYEDCKTCDASGTYNCHGCHGAGVDDHGDKCNYCNGTGKMKCEVCGGVHFKYKLCSRCAGFTIGCPKCEIGTKYCGTCGGNK